MPQQLKKIVRIPLRDQILDSIKRAIITGKFRASEKISEEELAEQLGVSRTPIREAIRVLEQQGLVEVIPEDGTYVTSFDSDQIKDGLHVRVALEQLALNSPLNDSRILSGGSIVSISRIWSVSYTHLTLPTKRIV